MGVVEFRQDLRELIKLAASAASEGKYVFCVHNLLDALREAANDEERSAVYRCFSDMFSGMDNVIMGRNALFRGCITSDKGGYYSLAYDKFFPVASEEFSDELPIPDGDTILGYNDVYNFFQTGQFDKGLDILCELTPDVKCLDEVIGLLYDAIEKGKTIDLSKHAYKLLILAGIFSTKSGDFVRLMLQGCAITRALMTDGVNVFCEETEDKRVLCDIGEAFVDEGEYECGRMCFERVLEECEIDECALFYSAAIAYANGDKEKYEEYWSRYKLVYKPFGAPTELFERTFGKTVPVYGTVPATAVKRDADLLETGSGDEYERANALCAVLSFGSDEILRNKKLLSSITDEQYFAAVKKVLLSTYVEEGRKVKLLNDVLERNYEGRMAIAFDDKGVAFDCVPLENKTARSIWHRIYVKISVAIICAKGFLPYRPSFLAYVIKQIKKGCSEHKIKPTEEDEHFLSMIIATCYNGHAAKNTNMSMIDGLVPPLSASELKAGLDKFPPEVITF